ncbi:hypothetical protein GGU11DRAFT_744842 [Lentinula aff. detonsa]|nr:hypothetical protein GGU11DRAFT_744842 [Lentinula aff. detonsa]
MLYPQQPPPSRPAAFKPRVRLACHPPSRPIPNESVLDSFGRALHPATTTQSPGSKRVRNGPVCCISTLHLTRLPPTQLPDTKRVRSGLVWPCSTPSNHHPVAQQQTSPFRTRLPHLNLGFDSPATHPVARYQTSPFWTRLVVLYTQRPPPSCPAANETGMDSFAAFQPHVRPACHPLSRSIPNESVLDSFGRALPPATTTQSPGSKRIHSGLVCCIPTSCLTRLPPIQSPDTKRVRSGLVWSCSTPSDHHPVARQQTSPFRTRLLHFNLAFNPPATHPVARYQTSPFWTRLVVLYPQRPPPTRTAANTFILGAFAAIQPCVTPIHHSVIFL